MASSGLDLISCLHTHIPPSEPMGAEGNIESHGPQPSPGPVTSSDIPTLGRLFGLAFAPDRLGHFIFSHGYDLNLSIHYSQVSYRTAYEDPNKWFLKAVDDATGEIVGFIIWSSIEKQADESEMEFQPPLNKEDNQVVSARFQSRRVNTMIGMRYIRKLH